MANPGNKPLKKKEAIATPDKMNCLRCNDLLSRDTFYDSDSELYQAVGKIPYCLKCLDEMFAIYAKHYKKLGFKNCERKAIERLCMALDLYYYDNVYDSAVKEGDKYPDTPLIARYIKQAKLYQYRKYNYNKTIEKRFNEAKSAVSVMNMDVLDEEKKREEIVKAEKFFGNGFEEDDYLYLYEQYCDWTTRHECETKSQEEMFKQICFTQLDLLKAKRMGADTKDLSFTLLKQMEAAKLQPKQNASETVADTQTFGTLIDKWENTRPIPEIDEDLRDVDKIGWYIDVFFRGHLAKMMGLKNGLSNLYTKFIEKFTVKKPEYKDNEDGEALFDTIFGNVDIGDT